MNRNVEERERIGFSDHYPMIIEVLIDGSIERRVLAPIGKKILRKETEKIMKEMMENRPHLETFEKV